MPMLLQDRILIVLHGGGPRTNSEIAEFLGGKLNSVRTANTQNVQVGRVSFNRETSGESKMWITPIGIARIQSSLMSSYVCPPTPTPVQDELIRQLRIGLWTTDWAKVVKTKSTLYKWIIKLEEKGYIIRKKKDGVAVFYKIIRDPISP